MVRGLRRISNLFSGLQEMRLLFRFLVVFSSTWLLSRMSSHCLSTLRRDLDLSEGKSGIVLRLKWLIPNTFFQYLPDCLSSLRDPESLKDFRKYRQNTQMTDLKIY